MRKYDIAIVGGGIAGLGVSALLSKRGYTTILLEKEPFLGGRSASFPYRGYTVDIGLHAIASYSSSGIGDLLEEVEAPLELVPIRPSLMHYDLDTRRYSRATSPDRFGDAVYGDFRNLINSVVHLSKDEIDGYHSVSAESWLMRNFGNADLVEFFKKITGFAGQPMDKVSAGAFLETLYDAFTSKATITYPTHGGIKALSDALETSIKKCGGEIVTSIDVQRVLIDGKRKVKGVKAKITAPSFVSEVQIDAPTVVMTVPLINLTRFVPKALIREELLEKIERIRAENYYYVGLIAGVEAALFDSFSEQFFQWTVDRPGMDWHAIITVPSYVDPALAPEGYHLMFIDSHGPMPYGGAARVRKRQGELLEILKEIWPDFEDKIDWLHPVVYPNILPLPQKSLTGPFRPGFSLPDVAGFYLAGDATYLSGSGIGSAVKSAFECMTQIEKDICV